MQSTERTGRERTPHGTYATVLSAKAYDDPAEDHKVRSDEESRGDASRSDPRAARGQHFLCIKTEWQQTISLHQERIQACFLRRPQSSGPANDFGDASSDSRREKPPDPIVERLAGMDDCQKLH